MTQALLELRDAAFGYGGQPVVSGVDLRVEAGAFLGVLGSNGSGKTTLLRGLLGLLEPLRGRVDHGAARFGYVPQRETLDPVYPLTVEEVVAMGGYGGLRGLKRFRSPERTRARECLERVQLLGRRGALFSKLSGGQRQRALIARALVTRPNLLVLDEPTSGVDQQTQELVLDLLRRLNAEGGLAIVLVSHQAAMTRAVRDVLWVADGTARRRAPGEVPAAEALEELHDSPGGEVGR